MAKPAEAAAVISASGLVVLIPDFFPKWTEIHRASKTYKWHRDHIQRLVTCPDLKKLEHDEFND